MNAILVTGWYLGLYEATFLFGTQSTILLIPRECFFFFYKIGYISLHYWRCLFSVLYVYTLGMLYLESGGNHNWRAELIVWLLIGEYLPYLL